MAEGYITASLGSSYDFYVWYKVINQSIENNTSTVRITWGLRKKAANNSTYNLSGSARLWGGYGGSTAADNLSVTYDMRSSPVGTEKDLLDRTYTISHQADGTKTLHLWGSFRPGNVSGMNSGDTDVGGDVALPTIPRATTPTLNETSADMGTTISISTVTAALSSFKHELTYSLSNGTTGRITAQNADIGATTKSWTVPNFASSIPNATSGAVTITCVTKDGSGTVIGTKTVSFTATVPASVVPSISALAVSEGTSGIAARFGAFIQNKSKFAVSVTAAGASGSEISSVSTVIEGRTYSGTSFTSNVIIGSGSLDIVTTVMDSRGRKATLTKTVYVLAYSTPTISTFEAWRVDTSGNAASDGSRVKISGVYSAPELNGKNTLSGQISYKQATAQSWDSLYVYSQLPPFGGGTVNINEVSDAMSVDYSWDIEISVTDWFGATTTAVVQIPTAEVILDFAANGKGLGIGKVSETDGVDIAWKILKLLAGEITVENMTATGEVRFKGCVRLKNDTAYGMKLNFGDGEYVYISEPVDDHMEIHANSIRFTGMGQASLNPLPILQGGHGATTASGALVNLGAAAAWNVPWTNSSPTSNFAAHTISISNLSNHNLITIVYSIKGDAGICSDTFYVPSTSATAASLCATRCVENTVFIYQRKLTINRASNTIAFGDGLQAYPGRVVTENGDMIPLYILCSTI